MKSTDTQPSGIKALLENSVSEILSLRQKVEHLQTGVDEPVAVVGMGCRFPGGANTPEAFWQLLKEGGCAVRDMGDERWSTADYYHPDAEVAGKLYSQHAGLLDRVDHFDAQRFKLPAHEANAMDPQQRLLLMVCWEALRNANLDLPGLKGSKTGVFLGMSTSDYARLAIDPLAPQDIDAYACLGNAHSVAAGRISYLFGFHGPALALDTSCSSSLLSVHLACKSLRAGESTMALAGGVNLILSPENSIGLSRMQALSRRGLCRTFDAEADGYVRGEGCGVVVLKTLSQARRDNDHIYAVIRGSAVNHDGASNGLTAPNGRMQQEVIEQALKQARLSPGDIHYVETHGTGTPLGDPIEVNALLRALRQAPADNPLVIGSVKTNIGHLESAAGIAALIKLCLSLKHQLIVPHLHFTKPNPHINWADDKLVVPTQCCAWPRQDALNHAGVSAFGLSGTNVHMILSSAEESAQAPAPGHFPGLLTFCASSAETLKQTSVRWSDFLRDSPLPFAEICSSSNTYRHNAKHRLSVVADSTQDAQALLQRFAAGERPAQVHQGVMPEASAALCMLFTGQGSQYAGMGQQLYATQAVFREALEQCDTLYTEMQGHSIKDILWGERTTELTQTQYTQPAIFCIQYALTQLWASLGIAPAAVIGHSLGEYAAACAAGVFSVDDGLRLIIQRGRLMHSMTAAGSMLAVQAGRQTVEQLIAPFAAQVSIAADNGPNDLVISGSTPVVEQIKADLEQRGIRTTALAVSRAFHSALMAPMLDAFKEHAGQVRYSAPTVPFYSTVLGRRVDVELCDPAYWAHQVAAPVEFHQALLTLAQEQPHGLLEVGPSPTLVDLASRSLPAEDQRAALYSLRKGHDEQHLLRDNLARLYVQGLLTRIPGNDGRKHALPVEVLDEKPYWVNGGKMTPVRRRDARPSNSPQVVHLRAQRQWHVSASLGQGQQPLDGRWLMVSESADFLAAVEDGAVCKVLASDVDSVLGQAHERFDGVLYVACASSTDISRAASEYINHFIALSTRICAAGCLAAGARLVVAHYNSDPMVRLMHSGGVGVTKTLAQEYPHLRFSQVDLRPADSLADDARRLLAWVARSAGTGVPFEVRIEQDSVCECRLEDLPAASPATAISLKAGRSYLITGGLGALGLTIAQGLASRGAEQVLLVSRRSEPSDAQQALLDALREQGCDVRLCAVDVCDRLALSGLIAACGQSFLPLAGVVHAAGALSDGRLEQLTAATAAPVLAPKITGGWHLHELTRHLQLDFFALFSSASAVFGNYAQGAYCAANSFLDELAAYRVAQGLVATSFAWGPWAGAGMASADTAAATLRAQGLAMIEPDEGLELFFSLLSRDAHNPVLLDLLPQALEHLQLDSASPALLRLYGQAHSSVPTQAAIAHSPLQAYLERMHPVSPAKAIESLLRDSIAEVSGHEVQADFSSDSPLIEMGLDSLMAVQLRNRLSTLTGEALPVSLLFDYPSLARLGDYLLSLHNASADTATLPASDAGQRATAVQDIAIIGIGCRYPGGVTDAGSFWQLLVDGVDGIGEVGNARWNNDEYFDADPDAPGKMYSRWGGLLDDVSHFDNRFFNISAQEAISMDPQQRLLLEVGWETLENAGITPAAVVKGGIFVGCGPNEYSHILNAPGAPQTSAYFATGNSISVNAGRLAYFLGWEGPAIAIDTACSSSLVSVALACQSLRNGECSVALAGGVNLTLSPHTNIALSKAHMLSPDGRCKTFDQSANGYVRSEGCGLVLLKPLEDALREGDQVLSVIKGCSINQDGRSQGLTAPSGPAQERVMRAALAQADIAPARIQYLEAHGTGTPLGDPIEMHSIEAVYGQRDGNAPLYVGSVKTNLGHTEAAAGVASLIKLSLMLQHRTIVRNLHLTTLNQHFSANLLGQAPSVIVADQPRPWPATAGQATGAVSSFGFSGTNAHLILAAAPQVPQPAPAQASDEPCLLALSARSTAALEALKRRYLERLQGGVSDLPGLCHSASTRRAHFEVRQAFVASTTEALCQQLQQPTGEAPRRSANSAARVAFLFTGQGSQYLGMGRALYVEGSLFKQALDQCAALMQAHLPGSILDVIWADDTQRLDNTYYTQPALFALQYALGRQWMGWGVVPDYVLGHSVGEYAAACLAGVMSLEDAIALICARARLMVELCETGSMLVVHASCSATRALLARLGDVQQQLSIAAHNGPANTVVAGCSQTLQRLIELCATLGVDTQSLRVSHGFHSPLMAPMLEAFRRVAAAIRFKPAAITFVSTVTGTVLNDENACANYWVEHVRAPVLFNEALATLATLAPQVGLEIGPGTQLIGMAKRCLEDAPIVWLSSLKAKAEARQHMLSALAALYAQQVTPVWSAVFPSTRTYPRIALPTYAFQRSHFWPQQQGPALFPGHLSQGNSRPAELSALGQKTVSATGDVIYQTRFDAQAPFPIADHRLYGTVVIAGATHLAMSALIAENLDLALGYELSDVTFPAAMVFADDEAKQFQYLITRLADQRLSIAGYSRTEGDNGSWQQHFTSTLTPQLPGQPAANAHGFDPERLCLDLDQQLDGDRFYAEMAAAGYALEGGFRWVERIWRRPGQALARLRAPQDAENAYIVAPGLMDAFFQTSAAASYDQHLSLGGRDTLYIPFAIDAMRVFKQVKGPLWCHVQCLSAAPQSANEAELEVYSHRLTVYDQAGEPVVAVEALRSKRAPKSVLIDSLKQKPSLAYHIDWVDGTAPIAPQPLAALGSEPLWLILADRSGHADLLRQRLEHAGIRCLLFNAEAGSEHPGQVHYDLDRLPEGLATLLEPLSRGQTVQQVINLQGLDHLPADAHDLPAHQRALLLPALAVQQYYLHTGVEPDWTFAAAIDTHADATAPIAGMLRGLAKVLGEEHPQARIKHVSVTAQTLQARVDCLCSELGLDDDESEIRYIDGARQVARLSALAYQPVDPSQAVFHADRSYLITGGLGAIGLSLAELIIQRGGRHLVLVARTAEAAQLAPQLARWQAMGASVLIRSCDVAQQPRVMALIDEIDRTLPPLDGVFHCAGTLRDGLLGTQTWDDFQAPLAAKVHGAWWLHQATRARQLSWFVLFSSAATVFGSPGQGNYAAANAFLDQLAISRRANGLCALSINWGPWNGDGMANATGRVANFQRAPGVGLLPPQEALEAMLALAGTAHANPTVIDIDWTQIHAAVSQRAQRSLLSGLVRKPADSARYLADLAALRSECDQLAAPQRRACIEQFVLKMARDIMAMNDRQLLDVNEPLQSEGLDSLMALELRNKLAHILGRKLPATLLFDYPTVRAMSAFIADQLYPPSAAPLEAQAASRTPAAPVDEDNFSDLSDDELLAMLADEAL